MRVDKVPRTISKWPDHLNPQPSRRRHNNQLNRARVRKHRAVDFGQLGDAGEREGSEFEETGHGGAFDGEDGDVVPGGSVDAVGGVEGGDGEAGP